MILRNEPFDIALIDMQMPGMDGFALGEAIRRHRDAKSLPLILLSSVGSTQADVRAKLFLAQLSKPVRPSRLYRYPAGGPGPHR